MLACAAAASRQLRRIVSVASAPLPVIIGLLSAAPSLAADPDPATLRLVGIDAGSNSAVFNGPDTKQERLTVAHRLGHWTLMAVLDGASGPLAVMEDLADRTGDIIYLDKHGIVLRLATSAAPTSASGGSLYGGHTFKELADSQTDLLSTDLLRSGADPDEAAVAAVLPPLQVPSFVGTPQGDEKPTFDYGGFSDEIYVDVGKLYPAIRAARQRRDVLEGLIGGWLPINRFVFPSGPGHDWEEDIFADVAPGHFWTQPVWYRTLEVQDGTLKQAHYFYHHLPYPPRGEPAPSEYYKALLALQTTWTRELRLPMSISVPDARTADFLRRSLSLVMLTRVGDHPKYGYPPLGGINVFGGYGYNNVDTFQDTLNADVSAFVEWGDFATARGYIEDYFTQSVRDDGSIDTRGPELGQYGKMLAVVAKYDAYSHDDALLLHFRGKLDAVASMLGALHADARKRPASDVSYGILRGWSEHDSSLKVDPYTLVQPHLSANAEVARGLSALGAAWIRIGQTRGDVALRRHGQQLAAEAQAIRHDLLIAYDRSVDHRQTPALVPPTAGGVPTYAPQRALLEMLESAELRPDQVRLLEASMAARGETMLGLPRWHGRLNGFLDFGPAYSKILDDDIPQFLLFYEAHMDHIYSPGTWTATESAMIDGHLGGPYCTPAQDTMPILTKWMLVFEEPDADVLWLARATPRRWLEPGKTIAVTNAPTRFGPVSYRLHSESGVKEITALVDLRHITNATAKLRIRAPQGQAITRVTLDGRIWTGFSAADQTITLPAGGIRHIDVSLAF